MVIPIPATYISRPRDLEQLIPSNDSSFHVEFDDQDAYSAKENWGNALVGYFIGSTPSFLAMKSSLQKAWRTFKLICSLFARAVGSFFARFIIIFLFLKGYVPLKSLSFDLDYRISFLYSIIL